MRQTGFEDLPDEMVVAVLKQIELWRRPYEMHESHISRIGFLIKCPLCSVESKKCVHVTKTELTKIVKIASVCKTWYMLLRDMTFQRLEYNKRELCSELCSGEKILKLVF